MTMVIKLAYYMVTYLQVCKGIGDKVGIYIDGEVESGVVEKVGEVVEGGVVLITISKMNSM